MSKVRGSNRPRVRVRMEGSASWMLPPRRWRELNERDSQTGNSPSVPRDAVSHSSASPFSLHPKTCSASGSDQLPSGSIIQSNSSSRPSR